MFIIKGFVVSWQDFFEEEARTGDWIKTMRHSLMIYEGKICELADIEEDTA